MRKAISLISTLTAVLTLALSLTFCTERIDIDTGSIDSKVVVYGTLVDTEGYQSIVVRSTRDYFDPDFHGDYLAGAEIKIYTASGKTYELVEYPNANGFYASDMKMSVEPGELLLEMNINEETHAEGAGYYLISEIVPQPVQLDSITIERSKLMGVEVFNLYVYAQDPPDEENYYLFSTIVKNSEGAITYSSTAITSYTLMDDSGFDGTYMDKMQVLTFISSKYNSSGSSGSGVIYVSPGDEVTLQMSSISEGYYKFLTECQSVKNGTNPFFGGPPSNIYTNIPGGAGYFTGHCPTFATAVVPE